MTQDSGIHNLNLSDEEIDTVEEYLPVGSGDSVEESRMTQDSGYDKVLQVQVPNSGVQVVLEGLEEEGWQ